jgi:fatty-acyl-CoA synthase
VKFGVLDLALGYDLMTQDWAPKAAMLGVATSVLALIVALFARLCESCGRRLLLALAITVATLAGMVAAKAVGGMRAADPRRLHRLEDAAELLGRGAGGARRRRPRRSRMIPACRSARGLRRPPGRRRQRRDLRGRPAAGAGALAADAYEAAKAAVQASGLTIVTDDPMDGRLEATGKSFWYGLKSTTWWCGCGPTPTARGSTCAPSAATRAATWAATAAASAG